MCDISKSTFTLTYGDCAENHRGMQMIGSICDKGFTIDELQHAAKWFQEKGIPVQIHELNKNLPAEANVEKAYILIAKGGANAILQKIEKNAKDMFEEQNGLSMDKKAFMYGRVVNKHARWNLCFGAEAQTADIAAGKGTIVPFADVPCLETIRTSLPEIMGAAAENLVVEGNYYYESKKCGIGFHGDSERTKVIGVRLGATMPLCYQWYYRGNPVGDMLEFQLEHGDIYVMSDKAVGRDWKRKLIYTLRHAAGCKKFTTP